MLRRIRRRKKGKTVMITISNGKIMFVCRLIWGLIVVDLMDRIFISSTLETKWAQREPEIQTLHFFFFFLRLWLLFYLSVYVHLFVHILPTRQKLLLPTSLLLLLVTQTLNREVYIACPLNVPLFYNPFLCLAAWCFAQHFFEWICEPNVEKGFL